MKDWIKELCPEIADWQVELIADHHQAEIERLNKALTWEQNRSERIGTHAPGCHLWGDRHYECLLREFNKEKNT